MSFGLGPDDDLDIAIEEGDEAQQPLGGEPAQLVVLEVRDVRLRNAEELCANVGRSFALRESAV
jgi:hypothetical protein